MRQYANMNAKYELNIDEAVSTGYGRGHYNTRGLSDGV